MTDTFDDVASIDFPDHRRGRARERAARSVAEARAREVAAARAAPRAAGRCATSALDDGKEICAGRRSRRAQAPRLSTSSRSAGPTRRTRQLRHTRAARGPRRRRDVRAGALPQRHAEGRARDGDERLSRRSRACAPTTSGCSSLRGLGRTPGRRRRSCRRDRSRPRHPRARAGHEERRQGRPGLVVPNGTQEPKPEDDASGTRPGGRLPGGAAHRQAPRKEQAAQGNVPKQPVTAALLRPRGLDQGRGETLDVCREVLFPASRPLPAVRTAGRGEHRLDPDAARAGRRHVAATAGTPAPTRRCAARRARCSTHFLVDVHDRHGGHRAAHRMNMDHLMWSTTTRTAAATGPTRAPP